MFQSQNWPRGQNEQPRPQGFGGGGFFGGQHQFRQRHYQPQQPQAAAPPPPEQAPEPRPQMPTFGNFGNQDNIHVGWGQGMQGGLQGFFGQLQEKLPQQLQGFFGGLPDAGKRGRQVQSQPQSFY